MTSEREALIAELAQDQRAISRAMVRHHLRTLAEHRLSAGQLHALVVLDTLGQHAAGELARQLGVTAATATGVVDRLVRDGLVQRTDDPDDGRSRIIRITDAGRAAWSEALLGPTAIDDAVIARLTIDELRLIVQGGAILRGAIEQVVGTASQGATAAGSTGSARPSI